MQDQLKSRHIIESQSVTLEHLYIIKKKSGKWRLLQDLRKINETIVLMGTLQPGLPTPVAIPKGPTGLLYKITFNKLSY